MATQSSGARVWGKDSKSKFLKGITDRQEEILGWAREGRPNVEFARQLGQMTENVTLDMMLNEKLLELSRARYKFKVNNRFEKKMFLQRQQQKSGALRDKLRNVAIEDVRPSWAKGRPVSRPASGEQAPAVSAAAQRPKRARVEVKEPESGGDAGGGMPAVRLKKPDSAPLRRRSPLDGEALNARPQTRGSFYGSFTMSSQPRDIQDTFFVTQAPQNPGAARVSFSKSPAPPPPTSPQDSRAPVANLLATPSQQTLASRALSTHSAGATQAASKSLSRGERLAQWAEENRQVGRKRYARDARFLGLERSLSTPYVSRSSLGVRDVISMIGTLQGANDKHAHARSHLAHQARALFTQDLDTSTGTLLPMVARTK